MCVSHPERVHSRAEERGNSGTVPSAVLMPVNGVLSGGWPGHGPWGSPLPLAASPPRGLDRQVQGQIRDVFEAVPFDHDGDKVLAARVPVLFDGRLQFWQGKVVHAVDVAGA